MTRSLLAMADRLRELGVTRVVMEATSDYWKPPFYLLEAHGFETWLVNAKDVKHLPGRPKTDKLDAVWLCKVAERQMIRPSFVPPPPIRWLRDLTRYRVDLVAARTAEKQRVEKLLEDAQIKLSVVAQDIFGVSGRDDDGRADRRGAGPEGAGPAGPRPDARQDPRAGGGVHRPLHRPSRVPAGQDARPGRRDRAPTSPTSTPGSRSRSPLSLTAVARLTRSPVSAGRRGQAIIAEIGLDMSRFPTAGHLASWARFAPGVKESAGRRRARGATGHGNRYLARVLGEAAVVAGRTDTFLGERYRRIARRRGAKKAIVAVGRSILIIVWHLLSDPDTRFHDLGADFYDSRTQPDRRNATTSANSRPSATRSPSNPPPDRSPSTNPAPPRSPSAIARQLTTIFGSVALVRRRSPTFSSLRTALRTPPRTPLNEAVQSWKAGWVQALAGSNPASSATPTRCTRPGRG